MFFEHHVTKSIPWIHQQSSHMTCLLLLISMSWHRQAISESKVDKLSSSAESRILTQRFSETESPGDWMPLTNPLSYRGSSYTHTFKIFVKDQTHCFCQYIAESCHCWKAAFHVSIKSSCKTCLCGKPTTGFHPWSYCNAVVKGVCGAVGVTDNTATIRGGTATWPKSDTWPMTLGQ